MNMMIGTAGYRVTARWR